MRNLHLHQAGAIALMLTAATALPGQSKPLLENDQVRVFRALEKPHVKGRAHKHDMNRVMIYFQTGTQNFEEDGKMSTLKYKAGDVLWSPKTGMHSPELTTDEPVNIVEVELKQPGAGKKITTKLDPLKVDSKHYKLEFQNDQVRVVRVKFGPHEGAPLHEHQMNRVVVYLKDQNVKMTTDAGKVDMAVHKPGEASWGEAVKHKEENQNDSEFEAIVVELL
jgi:quercetin dioxygenase-like cupin family protein